MNTPRYAYCTNALCNHLHRHGKPYSKPADNGPGMCPECHRPLRCNCPGCGHVLDTPPLRFCPACGQGLMDTVGQGRPCDICGRPVYRELDPGEKFVVCSSTCLTEYIQRYVKICDQCGKPFDISQDTNQNYLKWRIIDSNGVVMECCSEDCLRQYQKNHSCTV